MKQREHITSKDSPWLAFTPWGRAFVKLGNSLPWLPSSQGQTSTLFHFFNCFSQLAFCSNLQWGFKTIHIHKAPNLKERGKHLKMTKLPILLNSLFQNRLKSAIFRTLFSQSKPWMSYRMKGNLNPNTATYILK